MKNTETIIIPVHMFKTIVVESGKPNIKAIILLADILERAKQENSAEIQYTYQQMSDKFGISKREATNAITELEKMGIIERVFKTLTVNGLRLANVLFIRVKREV